MYLYITYISTHPRVTYPLFVSSPRHTYGFKDITSFTYCCAVPQHLEQPSTRQILNNHLQEWIVLAQISKELTSSRKVKTCISGRKTECNMKESEPYIWDQRSAIPEWVTTWEGKRGAPSIFPGSNFCLALSPCKSLWLFDSKRNTFAILRRLARGETLPSVTSNFKLRMFASKHCSQNKLCKG